ncbi:hypothetical protein NAEGRDRAFT_79155 [Naegleria gruberi]|uniref:Uncharacterized protein n=1 Tax=Naegleria gruberi TaxID=5762 RepID=D2V9Y4_NAEGR|nr:uncharacterized protein NAEGRDRAFT_79155 [Naegleria gruberi]EFC46214.1 hypothetical protein NAEGRDRAFT_79155 [Naegleria gruberi]|eukprot:XP_002678958.1 hypothetical protein NAEGRDRAFT_79155 [Naegleria gruberi strain NEG-M]
MSIIVTPSLDEIEQSDLERKQLEQEEIEAERLLPESFDFTKLKKQLSSENIAKKSFTVDPEQLINTVTMLLETVEKQEKNIRSLAKAVAQKSDFSLSRQSSFNTGVMITDPPKKDLPSSRPTTPKVVHKETVFVREDDPFMKNQIHNLNNEFAIIQEEYTQHETRLTEVEAIVHEQLTEEKMKTEKKIDEAKEMITVLKFDKEELRKQMDQLRLDVKKGLEENIEFLSNEIKTHFDISNENLERLQDDYNQKISAVNSDLGSKIVDISNKVEYNFMIFKERTESQKNEIEELKFRLTKLEENLLKKMETLSDKMDKNFRLLEKDTLKTNYITNLLYDVFQLDKHLITDLNDTYVQEKFQAKEDIGKYSKMKKEKNRQEYRKMYTDMLMTTPCFKTIYDNSTNIVNELRWETKLRMDREGDKVLEEFTDIRECMKRFVTFPEVRAAINENEIVRQVVNTVGTHEKHIDTIFTNFLPREEAWEALKQKADEKNVELKADRKIVNALFDYLNEKLNTILGKTSTEEMMVSIKKLEEKIKSKADKQELIEAQQPIYPPNIINIVRKDISTEDLVVGMGVSQPCLMAKGESEQSHSSSYRCLSCSRPLSSKTPSTAPSGSPPKRQNYLTNFDPLPVQALSGNESARGKLGTTLGDLQQQFQQQLQLQINPNTSIQSDSPNTSPKKGEKEKPNLIPPSSPSDFFEIPKLNLKKVMISAEMENPIFKYTIKSSGRSAEEEYEMVSARRDNTDLDKPPSQLQNQRKSPDDMRPKPPKSAPQGGQNNFMRYSLKSNLDLSNKVPGTAREKEQEKTSSVMPHSARPNSAKDASASCEGEEPSKKTKQSMEQNFISELEEIVEYCREQFEKESEDPDFIAAEIGNIQRKFYDLQNKYEKFKTIILKETFTDLEDLETMYNEADAMLNEAKEALASFIASEEKTEGEIETDENIENFIPLPELNEETEVIPFERSELRVENIEPIPLLTSRSCYICQRPIENSPVVCKYCSNACHGQCCDKPTILRGEDTMICEVCSSIETEGEPNFYSLIIKSKNGNVTHVNDIGNQLKGLSIDKYKIKCPKCQELVALKDLNSHTGRKFEFDKFSDYPFVPFSDEKNRAEISRVLIVFNISKKTLTNICESTDINVHPVVYFWKSKAFQIVIPSKHEMELVIPPKLDDFIERKWQVASDTSNTFYVVLKDVAYCFALLNTVHGLVLDNKQIAKVKAIQNPDTDKRTVLILNIYYASIEQFKYFILDCNTSFDFDWDVMVEEDGCQMLEDENSISIKFQSEEIAKAFVNDFNDSLFNEHHLQMFN